MMTASIYNNATTCRENARCACEIDERAAFEIQEREE